MFLVLDDKVSCIIGIDLDANKLAVTYTSSYTKGRAPSLVAKALIYLVQKAYALGYGLDVLAKVIPKESVAVAELYSMKKHGSSFRIEYKDLQKALFKIISSWLYSLYTSSLKKHHLICIRKMMFILHKNSS